MDGGTDPTADPLVYEEPDDAFYLDVEPHQGWPPPLHPRRQHRVERTAFRRRRRPGARVPGDRAARAGPRIPGRALRRALDRAQQLAGDEFPDRRSVPLAAVADRVAVARRRRAPRRCLRARLRAFSASSSRSKSAPAACARCASVAGRAARLPTWRPTSPPTARRSATTRSRHRHAALRLHVADHAGDDLRLRHAHRRADAAQARAGARRLRPGALRHRVPAGPRRATATRVPVSLVYRRDRHARRHRAAAAVRLRLLRPVERPGFSSARCQPARPRLRLSPSPTCAAARRLGRALVRRDGKLLQKQNTFTDFIDVTRFLVARGLRRPARVFAMRRQRRRPADGRGREPGAADLPRHRRPGAVRRRRHHDARRDASRSRPTSTTSGAIRERSAVLRLHALVLAVRQRRARRPIRRCW